MPDYRLGDLIDDYCSRCRRLMDHSVAVVSAGEMRKVRCRICDFEHDYRHGRVSARRTRLSPYEEILAKMGAPPAAGQERPKRSRR